MSLKIESLPEISLFSILGDAYDARIVQISVQSAPLCCERSERKTLVIIEGTELMIYSGYMAACKQIRFLQ